MSSRAIPAVVALAVLATTAPAGAEEEQRGGGRGPILAVEIGVGGVTGEGATIYAPGLGKAFILGYRLGPATFEWHFAQGYRMAPESAVLDGEDSRGSMGMSTVGVRYSRQRLTYVISGFGGVTRATMPLLSLVSDSGGETTVERRDLVGVGAVGGVGIALPVRRGQVQVGLELRAAYPIWEQPGYGYVVDAEPASDNTVTFTQGTDDLAAIPWTAAVSLRALL